MSYGLVRCHTVSMASDSTLSTLVDLGDSGSRYAFVIPTMTSATDCYIRGCDTDSGTFRRIYHQALSATGAATFTSTVTNAIVPLNCGLPRYVKVELSTAMTATPATFKFLTWP